MTWVAVSVSGAAIVGGIVASNSSSKAASAQTNAANQANATSQAQSDQARADNAPWRDRGNAAGNKLQNLMGLSTSPQYTADDYRNQLLQQYTSPATYSAGGGQSDGNATAIGGTVDEAGLQKAIGARMQQQSQDAAAQQSDPAYGSLLRKFSQSDLTADPVYQNGLQFGLDQGVRGINAQASARGGLNSGATLKALTRFGNDYGSTKAGDAYNRYTNDQNNQFNRLSGISGTGQVANQQIDAQGMNAANNIAQNQVGVGNARASGYIGQANAITGAIGQGYNMYQGNNIVGALRGANGGNSGAANDWANNNSLNDGYRYDPSQNYMGA
jgi:hypothetical protein